MGAGRKLSHLLSATLAPLFTLNTQQSGNDRPDNRSSSENVTRHEKRFLRPRLSFVLGFRDLNETSSCQSAPQNCPHKLNSTRHEYYALNPPPINVWRLRSRKSTCRYNELGVFPVETTRL